MATRTDPRGWAVAEVKDTGCGIPAENLARLFTSFFTTRPAKVGTGLGLSISQGIIRSLGGRIEVESAPGRGAVFRVVLPPAAESPAPRDLAAVAPEASPSPGDGTSSPRGQHDAA